jgi:hypothetical protein
METATQEKVTVKRRAVGLRDVDWKAVLKAGLLSGAAAMVLEMILVSFTGMGRASEPIRWMANLSFDEGLYPPFGILPTMVIAGLVYNLALSVEYTALLADFIAGRIRTATAVLIGCAFGLVLYWINFHVLSGMYPALVAARGWPTVVSHVFFGGCAAWLFKGLEPRRTVVA